MWPVKIFWGSNHITGTVKPKVVKIRTQVGYINFSNMMTYYPQKGRGYGYVTGLKFCNVPWSRASRGFVSDSWATCFVLELLAVVVLYLVCSVLSQQICSEECLRSDPLILSDVQGHSAMVSVSRFLPRDAMLAWYIIRLSVYLSVRPLHPGIVPKRLNIESRK